METTHTLDSTWATGEIAVRPGESIEFEGTVTGVSLEGIRLTFYSDDDGTYHYKRGEIPGFARQDVKRLIVKHAEMALIDAGFTLHPVVAARDYEP